MSEEDEQVAGYNPVGSAEHLDSSDRLTGGYGGEPMSEEEMDDTAGSTNPSDLGSTSPDSGLTAGGTDTSI